MFPLENSENSVHQSCCSKENVFTPSTFDDYLIILSAISDPLEIRKRLTYDLCLECDLKCFGLVLAKSQKIGSVELGTRLHPEVTERSPRTQETRHSTLTHTSQNNPNLPTPAHRELLIRAKVDM